MLNWTQKRNSNSKWTITLCFVAPFRSCELFMFTTIHLNWIVATRASGRKEDVRRKRKRNVEILVKSRKRWFFPISQQTACDLAVKKKLKMLSFFDSSKIAIVNEMSEDFARNSIWRFRAIVFPSFIENVEWNSFSKYCSLYSYTRDRTLKCLYGRYGVGMKERAWGTWQNKKNIGSYAVIGCSSFVRVYLGAKHAKFSVKWISTSTTIGLYIYPAGRIWVHSDWRCGCLTHGRGAMRYFIVRSEALIRVNGVMCIDPRGTCADIYTYT